MQLTAYLELMKERFTAYFNVLDNQVVLGQKVDLLARSQVKNEKYFAVKEVKLWVYENNEYCLFKFFPKELNRSELREFQNFLQKIAKDWINPHEEHFLSIVTGVVITDGKVSPEVTRAVEKYKHGRSFAWGLKGYCDVRLLLVDLENEQVFANHKGQEVKEFYRPASKI